MTTETRQLQVRGMQVDVIRKDIKNLHLAVYPPSGRVRIAVPHRLGDAAVRLAVVTKLGWIRRQQKSFESQSRQSRREFVSGECHYVEGRRYRLRVVERDGPSTVRTRANRVLEMCVRPGTDEKARGALLERWYRARLRDRIEELLPKWETAMKVTPAACGIRKMRTRWGTCHTDKASIWINLELAKKPVSCLEYIVVHELVHLMERRHTDRFRKLMDTYLPTWRTRRADLNRAPLGHEDWVY